MLYEAHTLELHADSSASPGHYSSLEKGKKIRHMKHAELSIQHELRKGRAKSSTKSIANPADLFTKYFTKPGIMRHVSVFGLQLIDDQGQEIDANISGLYFHESPENVRAQQTIMN